jgi:hypothetical protein
MMWKLINNCWLPRLWSPSVIANGAYFCEVAGPLDTILHDGAHAWKVEPGWWKRPPEAFQEQVEKLCPRCGMCLPMSRQYLVETQEKFSPCLLDDFRKRGAVCLEAKRHIKVFDTVFSRAEIVAAANSWYPTNYRDDQKSDQTLAVWEKGILACLTPDPSDPAILRLDSEEAYRQALSCVGKIGMDEKPRVWSFWYRGMAFDPIKEPYPFVLVGHEEENRLYRHIMLIHFRQLLDDTSFAALEAEPITREYLTNLGQRYKDLLKKWHEKWIERLGRFLSGKCVYFVGYGVTWKRFRKYFAEAQPRCFVDCMDDTIPNEFSVDGIKVKHIGRLLQESAEPLPFVIFCKSFQADAFREMVRTRYKDLVREDEIYLVTFTFTRTDETTIHDLKCMQ